MNINKYNKMTENKLILNKHILIYHDVCKIYNDISNLQFNFCGLVITDIKNDIDKLNNIDNNTLLYLCGDISYINNNVNLDRFTNIHIIRELSYATELLYKYNSSIHSNYFHEVLRVKYNLINVGEVPINIHNVGVLFKHFFNTNKDYFKSLSSEHAFQSLTESNKVGISYRKGLYITKVEVENDMRQASHERDNISTHMSNRNENSSMNSSILYNSTHSIKFNLLRCSTNFDGPTDNFRQTDNEIIDKVNNISKYFFEQKADLNHVLAQVYENTKYGGINQNKEVKATIKGHSDKTKDMPRNALIAFCTFYKNYQCNNFSSEELTKFKKSQDDIFDYVNKSTSVLTHLRFRLKNMVKDETLTKQFDVILYPNSVFLMSLNTNRLYTHEIVPSILPVDMIPTRLGYVIRCSTTKAIFKDNQTFIINDNEHIKLIEPTENSRKELKEKYYLENLTDNFVLYNDIYYSMNKGDYTMPNL